MAKRRVGRYPKEFHRKAVERLKTCDNIVELAQELGVHRRLLYKWLSITDECPRCKRIERTRNLSANPDNVS